MKYQGCLLAVKDISASKSFYETVLHQNAVMDIGEHVAFEGFSLQQGYADIVGIASDSVKEQSHNFQVYFEVEDLDQVYAELKRIPSLQWVHEIREYPWGQRDIRVYDPDKHIVEIAEDMTTVIRRFFAQGMSAEEVSKRPLYFTQNKGGSLFWHDGIVETINPYQQTGRTKAPGIDISDGKAKEGHCMYLAGTEAAANHAPDGLSLFTLYPINKPH